MSRFSARAKLAFGLTSLISTLLLVALVFRVLPDPSGERLEQRSKLCDVIAVSSSVLMGRQDVDRLEQMLTLIAERNSDIMSVGVRRADEDHLVCDISDHEATWEPEDPTRSTETHVLIPIYSDRSHREDGLWGNVEIRFGSLQAAGWRGLLAHPFVKLGAFLCCTCFLAFYLYLGKTLEHLDPSQAVPSRVRSALDTLAESLLVIDSSSRIMLTNSAFEQLTGKSSQETMGQCITELEWLMPDNLERPVVFPWDQTLADAETHSNVMLRLRVEDRIHTFAVNCSPVFGHEENLRGVLITLEDVTQLEEKKREAVAATEAKSLFLANMSHEIRTPMNAIIGFTDVLRRGIESDEEKQREYLDTIHSSGHHLIGLINDILDLSKIESGKLEIEKRSTSPHAMMLDVANVMAFKAEETGLDLQVLTDGPIPEAIETDPTRLRQILMNLLSNAVKFTKKGGVTIRARMEPREDRQLLAFDVIDTGVGIREDRIAQVFEPFVQADNTVTRRFGGTGLGLAISKQLAAALGGDLSATSVYGEGTTFTVAIDPGDIRDVERLTIDEARPRLRTTAASDAKQVFKLPPARVLLADDGEANRKLATLLLTRAGLTVEAVENGAEALAKAEETEFDLVLMDMQMPVLDGWSATRQLRDRGFEKPIIALTAAAMVEDAERCFEAGCDDFLTKPIELDKLMAAIGQALNVEPEIVDVEQEADEVDSQPAAAEAEAEFVPAVAGSDVGESAAADSATGDAAADREVIQGPPIVSALPTDDPEFREIVSGFVTKLRGEMVAIRCLAEDGNFDELRRKAHWLKGSAGTMGFHEITDPALTLEQHAKGGDRDKVLDALVVVEGLVARIMVPGTAPTPTSA